MAKRVPGTFEKNVKLKARAARLRTNEKLILRRKMDKEPFDNPSDLGDNGVRK